MSLSEAQEKGNQISAWNKFVPGGVFTLQTWLKQVFQTTLSLLILFLFSVALIWEKRAWKLLRCIITRDGKAMRGTKRGLLPDITVLRELSSGPGYLLQDIHSKHGPYFSEFLMCLWKVVHIKSEQWWPPWWSVSVWFVFFRRALGNLDNCSLKFPPQPAATPLHFCNVIALGNVVPFSLQHANTGCFLKSQAAELFMETIKCKLTTSIPCPWLQSQAPIVWVGTEILLLLRKKRIFTNALIW